MVFVRFQTAGMVAQADDGGFERYARLGHFYAYINESSGARHWSQRVWFTNFVLTSATHLKPFYQLLNSARNSAGRPAFAASNA